MRRWYKDVEYSSYCWFPCVCIVVLWWRSVSQTWIWVSWECRASGDGGSLTFYYCRLILEYLYRMGGLNWGRIVMSDLCMAVKHWFVVTWKTSGTVVTSDLPLPAASVAQGQLMMGLYGHLRLHKIPCKFSSFKTWFLMGDCSWWLPSLRCYECTCTWPYLVGRQTHILLYGSMAQKCLLVLPILFKSSVTTLYEFILAGGPLIGWQGSPTPSTRMRLKDRRRVDLAHWKDYLCREKASMWVFAVFQL